MPLFSLDAAAGTADGVDIGESVAKQSGPVPTSASDDGDEHVVVG